jgi:hypothetical protein
MIKLVVWSSYWWNTLFIALNSVVWQIIPWLKFNKPGMAIGLLICFNYGLSRTISRTRTGLRLKAIFLKSFYVASSGVSQTVLQVLGMEIGVNMLVMDLMSWSPLLQHKRIGELEKMQIQPAAIDERRRYGHLTPGTWACRWSEFVRTYGGALTDRGKRGTAGTDPLE